MSLKLNSNYLINNYLATHANPIICVVGPTCTGKTALAVEIAKKFDWELINADSRQVYRWIECITGLDYSELEWVTHHFFGVKDVYECYNLAEFQSDVTKLLDRIERLPIIVGWTGLFVEGVINWYILPKAKPNEELRKELETLSDDELSRRLGEVDPVWIPKQNRRRIIRALEVYYQTGVPISQKNFKAKYDPLILYKNIERDELYRLINIRQERLFMNSIEIIRDLPNKEHKKYPALSSIGIPEIIEYLAWNLSLKDAILLTQQKARNYAKRQMTWWRSKPKEMYD